MLCFDLFRMTTQLRNLSCLNTYRFDNTELCVNCLKCKKHYDFLKTKVVDGLMHSFFEIIERPFPMENNQAHQEISEEEYYEDIKVIQNCLFSNDLKFWMNRSLKIGNLILCYRRFCSKEKIMNEMRIEFGKSINVIDNSWDKTNLFFYKVERISDSNCKLTTYAEEDFSKFLDDYCKIPCLDSRDTILKKIMKALVKLEEESYNFKPINVLIVYLCISFVYGFESESFYFWT